MMMIMAVNSASWGGDREFDDDDDDDDDGGEQCELGWRYNDDDDDGEQCEVGWRYDDDDDDDDDDWRRTVRVGVEIGNMMMMMMIYANHLCPKKSQ